MTEKLHSNDTLEQQGPHSQSGLNLIQVLERVDDPRAESCNFRHPLAKMLLIAIVCSLCGSDDWETMFIQANAMKDWLAQFVDMSNGVPSVRTFKRVFSVLCPKQMNALLGEIAKRLSSGKDLKTVSFDGKAMRGTSNASLGLAAIQMLNAWSHEAGICLGHVKIDGKSNEIPTLPELMELLDLKGTIVTADALHTQKATASKIVDSKADYLLPVKGNHPGLLDDVKLLFREAVDKEFRGIDASQYETVEKSHGRIEVRRYYSIDASNLPDAEHWPKLQSAGMIVRERMVKGKASTQTHYYISSCEIDANLLAKVTRGHWGIENALHWQLDVTFREDKIRYRDEVGASNLSTIRKIVLGALSRDKTLKCGKVGKRMAAATDPVYRERILKTLF